MQDLWRQSASDLAKRIANRKVSSAEVVEAHLALDEDSAAQHGAREESR